jgi:uncharacterized RmlC-like cupin family protein
MLRVSKVEGRRNRPRDTEPARPDLRTPRTLGDCVIIQGLPGEKARGYQAGGEDCRRSGRDQQPGVSGPSSGAQALRLHLVMIPPGTRGMPHFHAGHETAIYVVSGEAEVWYGTGLVKRSMVRAGDFVYIPPGTPHLAVNRGDVTSIAVAARTDPADQTAAVVIELPRHLASLLSLPVGSGE